MTDAITGIDHVVIRVRDLDDAAARFRRLGFALTPRGRHTGLGTANNCAMFGARNYLELLAVVAPPAEGARFSPLLVERDGLCAVAWRTTDARAVGKAWTDAGLAPEAPIEFSRPVETEAGRKDARFCIVQLPPDCLPGAAGFVCQHDTPELVWRPGSTDHPNGARGIVAVTGIADAPGTLADAYGRALGANRVTVDRSSLSIETGSAPIRFITPARFTELFGGIAADAEARPPALAALTIAAGSLDVVTRQLDDNGVPYVAGKADGVVVGPDQACGTLIRFVAG